MATSRKKVLWVDDEIEFLRSHIMFLETRGYSVSPVFSGDDAIHMLKVDPKGFDIVLLDEQMPGMGGLETLENIKLLNPELPVVMVTKSEEESLMEQAIGKKIDGYLTKPVNPSQILSVCKKILHSKEIISDQLKEEFLRSYSAIKNILGNRMGHREWIRVYRSLCRWEVRLEHITDEAIRQALNGIRSDAEELFSNYIFSRYVKWMKGIDTKPVLAPDALDRYIAPLIKSDENIVFIVLNSLRYDQYFAIRPLLEKNFSLSDGVFYSILPSAPEYSRVSLLGGKYPIDMSNEFPEQWDELLNGGVDNSDIEEVSFKAKMKEYGISKDELSYIKIDSSNINKLAGTLEKNMDKRVIAIVGDVFDLFPEDSGKDLKNSDYDEITFRRTASSWFQESPLGKVVKNLSSSNFKVVLTSGNGSNYCSRGTECYGTSDPLQTFRYRKGKDISCDERYAMFIHEPELFKLPGKTEEDNYIVLKENYHFVNHDVYENYNEHYMNIFENGGISMKEMIMPFVIMDPESEELL